MRHRDSPVDAETFHLKEHRVVSGVGCIAAKNSSRRNHAQGCAAALHGMDLHRRGLRAQGKAVSRIESVLGRARGMGLRNVQRVEVVEVSLNFPIVLDRITESDKDVFNLFAQERDWMKVTLAQPSPRERDIDTFLFNTRLIDVVLESQFRTLNG